MTMPKTPTTKTTKPGSLLAPKKPKATTANYATIHEEIVVQIGSQPTEPSITQTDTTPTKVVKPWDTDVTTKPKATSPEIMPPKISSSQTQNQRMAPRRSPPMQTTVPKATAAKVVRRISQATENPSKCTKKEPPTMAEIIGMTKVAMELLANQRTTQEPKAIKDQVLSQLHDIVSHMENHVSPQESASSNRLDKIEQELREIKAAILEPVKSWAQITAPATTAMKNPCSPNSKTITAQVKQQKMERVRAERAEHEVTLSAHEATEETKSKLAATSAKEITQLLQHAINISTGNDDKPKLQGFNRLANSGIRLQCKTAEEAQQLRNIDWSKAFKGLKVHKPKYGIVIHGVPTEEFDITDSKATTTLLQQCNENIPITRITPLRRKASNSRTPAHQSIVVFTDDAQAADQCIRMGFFINYLSYPAERYTPQLNITQCYKCCGYAHRAAHCKRKQKCGKCGHEDHNSNECPNSERQCANCHGEHEAWHHECPTRIAESQRLADMKINTSPYFTK